MSIEDNNLPLNLSAFDFNNLPVRVVVLDGQPHFVATDVCKCLDIFDTSQAVSRLKDNEKLISVQHVSGQNRDVWLVNEPGLYRLIFRSDKPQAEPFQDWVYHQVLPAIRATGSYTAPSAKPPQDLATLVEQELKKLLRKQRKQALQKNRLKATTTLGNMPECFPDFVQINVELGTEYRKSAVRDAFCAFLDEVEQPQKYATQTVSRWLRAYAEQHDLIYSERKTNGQRIFKLEPNNPMINLPLSDLEG